MPREHFESINPATGDLIERYAADPVGEVQTRVQHAVEAQHSWRKVSLERRCDLFRTLADRLRSSRDQLARLATQEMGKPLAQALAEIDKCGLVCTYYADHASEFLHPESVSRTDEQRRYVRFDPLGVVTAIMPWNFPFWQVFRCAAPILVSGNVLLLKHANNVLGCSNAIESLFTEAGFPHGVLQQLRIGREGIASLLDDERVAAATLTGSTGAGRSVGEVCGRNLKKCVLELGGSDPFIVLPDAPWPQVIEQALAGRMLCNGQSCIAAKRFLVHRDVADRFVEEFAARMQAMRIDDPLSLDCDLGPLARADLRDELHEQVERSVTAGARLITGGRAPDRPGWFYEPTLLSNVHPDHPAFRQETFGPVAAVTVGDSVAELIELANQSCFGLGASIWTSDVEAAQNWAAEIDAGNVFINEIVKSDPSLPFGGVKQSGFGRELGVYGLREFTNVKSVSVKTSG